MIAINDKIMWSPEFMVHQTSQNIILLGVDRTFFLSEKKHWLIAQMILQQRVMSHSFDQKITPLEKIELYQELDHLQRLGIIQTSEDRDRQGEHSAGYFEDIVARLQEAYPTLKLVSVDDYLNPVIEPINQQHHQNSQPFLLLKLMGKKVYIGPYFSMEPGTPCWQCLASQMWQNQPVRKWLQRKSNLTYVPFPIVAQPHRPTYEQLLTLVQRAIDQPHTLFEVNGGDLSWQAHQVNHRPQCKVCGDPILMHKQLLHPVTFTHSLKSSDNKSGSRSVKAAETVQSLEKFKSALTGSIAQVMPPPENDKTPVVIYRSVFFKTPAVGKAVTQQDFIQMSLGKGLFPMQSQASALCETIERYAAQYQGDEYILQATADHLDARHYLPQQLVSFSATQYQSFAAEDCPEPEKSHGLQKYQTSSLLHWVPAWSLTQQEKVWLPFTHCFANTPYVQDEQYARWNSNGCSAGNTLEEAVLQGFYELVERDATAVWWYNKIARPEVKLEELPAEHLQRIQDTLGTAWNYWVLDISHDFEIPVMAGISQHKTTGKFCLGFGCHLNPEIACYRALTELCQLVAIRSQHAAPFDFDRISPENFLLPQGKKSLTDFAFQEDPVIQNDLLTCQNQAQKLGLEVLAMDYSRPDLPIKTAKVIIPGLCHIWPQLGTKRLYEVPVKLGWADDATKEQELNQLALYI